MLAFQKLGFDAVDRFARDMSESVSHFLAQGGLQPLSLSIASDAFSFDLKMDPQPLSVFEARLAKEQSANPSIPGNPNWENALYAVNGGYDEMPETLTVHGQTVRLGDTLYLATIGGEPCFGVKNAVKKAFGDKTVCFIGYTDDCAYLVDDRVLSEGGYEPGCHIEYNLKGPFCAGLDKIYTESFAASLKRL